MRTAVCRASQPAVRAPYSYTLRIEVDSLKVDGPGDRRGGAQGATVAAAPRPLRFG
jgi:hypothetical protein